MTISSRRSGVIFQAFTTPEKMQQVLLEVWNGSHQLLSFTFEDVAA